MMKEGEGRILAEFITPTKEFKSDCLLLEQGVENRDEDFISEWVLHKLEDLGFFLGLSYDGYELGVGEFI